MGFPCQFSTICPQRVSSGCTSCNLRSISSSWGGRHRCWEHLLVPRSAPLKGTTSATQRGHKNQPGAASSLAQIPGIRVSLLNPAGAPGPPPCYSLLCMRVWAPKRLHYGKCAGPGLMSSIIALLHPALTYHSFAEQEQGPGKEKVS